MSLCVSSWDVAFVVEVRGRPAKARGALILDISDSSVL